MTPLSQHEWDEINRDHRDEIVKLEAENKRLRKALEDIERVANLIYNSTGMLEDDNAEWLGPWVNEIHDSARAALKEGEK